MTTPTIATEREWIEFEGLQLPPLLRPRRVEEVFGLGHGVLYSHLNSGRIQSIALRESPKQKRSTRLVYTRSVVDFLRRCEKAKSQSSKE